MESCDVLIVGGGPAGSSLAWRLKDSGLDVLILDKSGFPRDKVCAGWITPAVLKTLEIDEREYGRNRTLQPITGFLTSIMNGPQVETRYDGIVSYGIRRSEFDHCLLQRSGARLRLGEPLKSLERGNNHWIINGAIKAPLIVGAGGHFCPVARFLGEKNDEREVVVAQEIEFEMGESQKRECPVRGDTPELYFCEDLKGYGWCTRKGDFLNIGLGKVSSKGVSGEMRIFLNLLRQKGRIPQNIPNGLKGHAYLLYGSKREILDDGVLLIGDAAGLAYPKSGEGILPAVESGLMAAEVILEAKGDYRQERLKPYASLLADRFGNPKKKNNNTLPEGLRSQIARRLMASEWFSRHILIDRWFLHSHKPLL